MISRLPDKGDQLQRSRLLTMVCRSLKFGHLCVPRNKAYMNAVEKQKTRRTWPSYTSRFDDVN